MYPHGEPSLERPPRLFSCRPSYLYSEKVPLRPLLVVVRAKVVPNVLFIVSTLRQANDDLLQAKCFLATNAVPKFPGEPELTPTSAIQMPMKKLVSILLPRMMSTTIGSTKSIVPTSFEYIVHVYLCASILSQSEKVTKFECQ
jgi:hypothetical protein